MMNNRSLTIGRLQVLSLAYERLYANAKGDMVRRRKLTIAYRNRHSHILLDWFAGEVS